MEVSKVSQWFLIEKTRQNGPEVALKVHSHVTFKKQQITVLLKFIKVIATNRQFGILELKIFLHIWQLLSKYWNVPSVSVERYSDYPSLLKQRHYIAFQPLFRSQETKIVSRNLKNNIVICLQFKGSSYTKHSLVLRKPKNEILETIGRRFKTKFVTFFFRVNNKTKHTMDPRI